MLYWNGYVVWGNKWHTPTITYRSHPRACHNTSFHEVFRALQWLVAYKFFKIRILFQAGTNWNHKSDIWKSKSPAIKKKRKRTDYQDQTTTGPVDLRVHREDWSVDRPCSNRTSKNDISIRKKIKTLKAKIKNQFYFKVSSQQSARGGISLASHQPAMTEIYSHPDPRQNTAHGCISTLQRPLCVVHISVCFHLMS